MLHGALYPSYGGKIDVVFVLLTVGLFAAITLLVRAVERL
jgi:hypothetical protein